MSQATKNWRTATVTPSMAKDVESTNQLDGLSRETASQKESNETSEYKTKKTAPGSLGAENSYS